MYKVLVVDDEHYSADYIVDLLRECNDFDFDIYKAYSGVSALKVLKKTKIDIMIADVKMPQINGIDLAKEAIALWPKCKIIFLSGHADFNYIYQSNAIANTRYLLKNEGDNVIIDAVSRAVADWEEEFRIASMKQTAEAFEGLYDYSKKKSALGTLFNRYRNNDSQDKIDRSFQRVGLNQNQSIYMLYAMVENNAGNNESSDVFDETLAVLECFREAMNSYCDFVMYDPEPHNYFWLLQSKEESETVTSYVREIMDELIRLIQMKLGKEVILVLHPDSIKLDGAAKAFQDLKKFAEKYFVGDPFVSLGVTYSGGEAFKNSGENLVYNVKQYVEKNLAEDVSLFAVARDLNYNSSYVSRIFKQQTNMKYSDYVIQKRMEKSVSLLESTNMTLQQIISKVGFESVRYFSTVFRKVYGVPPGRYREEHQKK